MIFARMVLADALGTRLAHGVRQGAVSFRKGRVLSAADIDALTAEGVTHVFAVRLEPGDVPEDDAAAALASALAGDGVRAAAPFTGRANLYALTPGVLLVNTGAIDAINAVDPAITVATLPPFDAAGRAAMLATVKIIPFAAPQAALNTCLAIARATGPVLQIAPYRPLSVALISTSLPQTKPSVHAKNRQSLEGRLAPSKSRIVEDRVVNHDSASIAAALTAAAHARPDVHLVFGASAIVDHQDVVPAAIMEAGGEVLHFGMPVDPGNLLLLGRLKGKPVIGLPGCARSPKLNGFDFVLQRLMAGLTVTPRDLMGMGVGGLLKEIPARPQPRNHAAAETDGPRAPRIAAILLAAGKAQRMGANKMTAELGGMPLVRRTAMNILTSTARPLIVVTGHEPDAVHAALKGLDVQFTHAGDFASGLSASLKAGISALPRDADGFLVCLGDMPGVTADTLDRLISAFSPEDGRLICAPVYEGKRGNPVLFATRYAEAMQGLAGDAGAKSLLAEFSEDVCEVETADSAILRDIDTEAALNAERRRL